MDAPRLSLVVEWDNARHYEVRRARRMLARVMTQVRELGEPTEIFLVFDELEIDGALVKAAADELRRDAPAWIEIRSVATQGLRYYELKNEGARHCRGDLIVFVDSDVLPEEGWLRGLVQAFRNPNVQVVMANTYVEADTFYAKTFALAWYFPLRSDGPLVVTTSSFVNSIAFRRDIHRRYPFPVDRELYIGQCLSFVDTLRSNKIDVYMSPCAKAAHPPPRLVRSAFINGHDAVIRERRTRNQGLPGSYWRLRSNLATSIRRITGARHEVGLSAWGVVPAMTIATTYYGFIFLAELLTRLSPGLVRRLYAI